MAEWLTEDLDRKPYSVNLEKLDRYLHEIERKQAFIKRYLEVHPKAIKVLYTEEKRKKRFQDSALSYLVLEGGDGIDPIPSKDKTEYEIEIEKEEMKNVLAYEDACEMMHNASQDENCYLDADLLIKAHGIMYSKNPDKKLLVRPRFRNENDSFIVMGQGYFDPVPGELVASRVNFLFSDFNNPWYEDHPIVKGAKFVSEYFRIQPHMDGNKRTALMALNFILEKNGLPDIYIDSTQAPRLFEALKTSILKRDVTDLALLISENVNTRYDHRVKEIIGYRVDNFKANQEDKDKN